MSVLHHADTDTLFGLRMRIYPRQNKCKYVSLFKLGTHHATFVGPTIVVCGDDVDDC